LPAPAFWQASKQIQGMIELKEWAIDTSNFEKINAGY
jgi:hypothetical protein